MTLVNVGGIDYHLDEKLKNRWDKIKDGKLAKVDEDRVYVVDGREGCGKSLFTIQQAAYIDPTILDDLSRITFDPEETLNAIRQHKSTNTHTKVIIFDEAFRGLSSRSAISKINKRIIQGLMEMRQNNLVLFIVLPSFFMLDLYPAVSRSNALFHIAKQKNSRLRTFKVFNYQKKARLYNYGIRKGWSYKIFTEFKGRFFGKYPGGDIFEEKYRAKKRQSLTDIDKEIVTDPKELKREAREKKYLDYWHKTVAVFKKSSGLSEKEAERLLELNGISIKRAMIGDITRKTKVIAN